MGKIDTVTKRFMSDNERFADAFNYYLFDGRQIIKPENLTEKDSTELSVLMHGDSIDTKDRQRDVMKRWIAKEDGHFTYVLLGIENQSNIHYAMPVRNNLEDAMSYMAQVDEIKKMHRKMKDLKPSNNHSEDEYLSGFAKDDKLHPVITLVLYFGTGKWDGPRSLYEMLDVEDETILKYVSDYKLNIIVPEEIEDVEKFHTDLKQVMEFIKVHDDEEAAGELLKRESENFDCMDNEAVMVLNTCIDAKIKVSEKEEKTNMCKAIQDMIERGRAEGRQEEHEKLNSKIISLYRRGLFGEDVATTVLDMTVEEFRDKMNGC